MAFDVVGVGASALDYLCVVPSPPRPSEKMRMEDFSVQGGGPAATAMVTAARLGMSACLFARTGSDSMGHFQLAELEREGVDVSYVSQVEGAGSLFAFVMVDRKSGYRSTVYNGGTLPPLAESDLRQEVIRRAGCVIVDPYELQAATVASAWAREASIPVILDADAVVQGVSQVVPLCDYVIGPVEFATAFAETRSLKRAVEFLLSYGPSVVIITMGERGCQCFTRDERFSVPAYKVDVVDTTGAGDVFHGACALGVVRGWDLRRIVEFASATAALKCTSLGARAGIPRLAEVERFMLHQRPG